MFELYTNTNYGGSSNIGRAIVFMNLHNHATKVEFVYIYSEEEGLRFYYENNTCIDAMESTLLEQWFVKTVLDR